MVCRRVCSAKQSQSSHTRRPSQGLEYLKLDRRQKGVRRSRIIEHRGPYSRDSPPFFYALNQGVSLPSSGLKSGNLVHSSISPISQSALLISFRSIRCNVDQDSFDDLTEKVAHQSCLLPSSLASRRLALRRAGHWLLICLPSSSPFPKKFFYSAPSFNPRRRFKFSRSSKRN
jgi:hypothetical protein